MARPRSIRERMMADEIAKMRELLLLCHEALMGDPVKSKRVHTLRAGLPLILKGYLEQLDQKLDE